MNVNFDSAPPIYIPFGFFLLGSAFAIFASISLLYGGYDFLAFSLSRAAITHLFTIGFFLTTMLGALFQVLPIIIGVNILKQNTVAIITSIGITTGSAFLFLSFKKDIESLPIAITILIISIILIVSASLKPILETATKSHTKTSIILALVSLIFTIFFGFLNAYKYFSPELSNLPSLREMHALWGLLGWIPLLIIGVSYQVIPMFHVCPNYPPKLSYFIPLSLFTGLLIGCIFNLTFGLLIYTAALFLYLTLSIKILMGRKRKVFDPTVRFWFLALTCSLIAITFAWSSYLISSNLLLKLAVIAQLFGFAGSVILGMQHKIIPFLVFMHLQKKSFDPPYPTINVPQMNDILSKRVGRIQFYLHLTWLVLFSISVIDNRLGSYAGVAGVLNFGLLAYCTTKGYWSYKKALVNI